MSQGSRNPILFGWISNFSFLPGPKLSLPSVKWLPIPTVLVMGEVKSSLSYPHERQVVNQYRIITVGTMCSLHLLEPLFAFCIFSLGVKPHPVLPPPPLDGQTQQKLCKLKLMELPSPSIIIFIPSVRDDSAASSLKRDRDKKKEKEKEKNMLNCC